MRKVFVYGVIFVLLLGLISGGFYCKKPSPTPTPAPTPTPTPTPKPTPTPTPKPTPTPTPKPTPVKPIVWRMQSAWPPGSLAYDYLLKGLCESVKKESGGRFEIKLYPPNALVKILEKYDAVSKGALEMACSAGLYHVPKVPEGLVEFGLPFTFTEWQQIYELFHEYKDGIFIKKLREAYGRTNTYYIEVCPVSSYGFMTKFPVEKAEDFKGKKIRAFGLFALFVKQLGASPVSIPGAEQYMALQRGTVDGTIYPYYILETYKLREVVDYAIFPPVLTYPTIEFYCNLDKWNALPQDLKELLHKLTREWSEKYIKKAIEFEAEVLKGAEELGVKLVTLPDDEVEKMKEASKICWAVAAKKSPGCAELLDIMKEYLKEKGLL